MSEQEQVQSKEQVQHKFEKRVYDFAKPSQLIQKLRYGQYADVENISVNLVKCNFQAKQETIKQTFNQFEFLKIKNYKPGSFQLVFKQKSIAIKFIETKYKQTILGRRFYIKLGKPIKENNWMVTGKYKHNKKSNNYDDNPNEIKRNKNQQHEKKGKIVFQKNYGEQKDQQLGERKKRYTNEKRNKYKQQNQEQKIHHSNNEEKHQQKQLGMKQKNDDTKQQKPFIQKIQQKQQQNIQKKNQEKHQKTKQEQVKQIKQEKKQLIKQEKIQFIKKQKPQLKIQEKFQQKKQQKIQLIKQQKKQENIQEQINKKNQENIIYKQKLKNKDKKNKKQKKKQDQDQGKKQKDKPINQNEELQKQGWAKVKK